MPGDPWKRDVRAGGKRRKGGGRRADDDCRPSVRRHSVQRQLPGQQPLERSDRRREWRDAREAAQHDDARGLLVVAAGVSADHGLVDAPRAPLPDATEGVDREVVGDVPEAPHVAVVVEDREQDAGNISGAIALRRLAVMREPLTRAASSRGSSCEALTGSASVEGRRAERSRAPRRPPRLLSRAYAPGLRSRRRRPRGAA
jgi:hypothetical protein